MKYFCASKLWKCTVSHRLGITPKCIEMLSTWKGSGNRRKEIEAHDWEKSLPPSLKNAWVPAFPFLILNWFLKRNTCGQRSFISRNTTLKDSLTNDVLHLMKININITSISNLHLGRLGTISPSNRSLAFHSINALRLVRDDANLPRSFF